jgi:hypothetical protein
MEGNQFDQQMRGTTMNGLASRSARRSFLLGPIVALFLFNAAPGWSQSSNHEFNDSHFHLTNNIQEGVGIREFLGMMEDKAGRVALFGVPLQQEWSYRVDGDRAPSYYLHSDAPLYYYSFTDASICHGLQGVDQGTAGAF